MAKRLIDAEALRNAVKKNAMTKYDWSEEIDVNDFEKVLAELPTVDAVEVIRCRDCKHWDNPICEVHSEWPDQYNTGHSDYMEPDDFCSYGERKEG